MLRPLFIVISCTVSACLNVDASTRTVGPAGGVVQFSNNVSIDVPAGALGDEQAITITRTGELPAAGQGYSELYTIEPRGLYFAQPLRVSIPFARGAGTVTGAARETPEGAFVARRTSVNGYHAAVELDRLADVVIVDPSWLPPVPLFDRSEGNYENDFVLRQSFHRDDELACYTIDGDDPTCTNSGACAGTSSAFPAEGLSVTEANPRKVLRAVTCFAGRASPVVTASYTLQVGSVDPTPWPGVFPGPITVTFLSGTTGSVVRYATTFAQPVNCETSTIVPDGGLYIAATTAIQFVGCKPGYKPSPINRPTDPYTIAP